MSVSKRTYTGGKMWLMDLETGFNAVRPRTAQLQENKDGSVVLFVAGWSDYDAAALYLLVNSNCKGNMLSEKVVAAKANEIAAMSLARQEPLNPAWLGHVIMSDRGAESPIAAMEEEAGATPKGEAPETHDLAAPKPFDPSLPSRYREPIEPKDDADEEPGEVPDHSASGVAEAIFGQALPLPPEAKDYSFASPALIRAARDGRLGFSPTGEPEVNIQLGGPNDPDAVRGMERSQILLSAPSAEISMRLGGEVWQTIKMLSLIWGESPDAVVLRLVGERWEYYRDPEVMSRLLRGDPL